VDGYARRLEHLSLAPVPSEPFDAPVLVAAEGFREGQGRAYGVELTAARDTRRGGFTASYTLSHADRTVAGERFVPRFHRAQVFDATAWRPVRGNGRGTVRLLLASGQPLTPVAGAFQPLGYDPVSGRVAPGGQAVFLLGEHNSARLPGYWRVDLGWRAELRRRWFGHAGTVSPYVQVLNVFNARNVLAAEPAYGAAGSELQYQPQLPILPSFGVEWRF
jgi:hypothetical protein